MDSIPQQTCSKCGQSFPLSSEHWHKNKQRKCGFHTICKICACAKTREWFAENKEYALGQKRQYYQDNSDRIRAYSTERRKNNPEKVRASGRKTYEKYKAKRQIQNKEWVEKHPDKVKAIKKAYIERNPERRKKQARDYNRRNSETLKIKHKEYRDKNPHIGRIHHNKRKARLVGAEGSHTPEDIKRLFQEQDGRCYYCGIRLLWRSNGFHVDHMIPLSRGGSNKPENLCGACIDCNLEKGVKTPDEWMAIRGW